VEYPNIEVVWNHIVMIIDPQTGTYYPFDQTYDEICYPNEGDKYLPGYTCYPEVCCGPFSVVPIVVAMEFVALRVNIWLRGSVVILMRVITRVFVVRVTSAE
jgi:hypothetical protein